MITPLSILLLTLRENLRRHRHNDINLRLNLKELRFEIEIEPELGKTLDSLHTFSDTSSPPWSWHYSACPADACDASALCGRCRSRPTLPS